MPKGVLSELWVFQEKVDMKVSAFSFTSSLLIFGYLWYDGVIKIWKKMKRLKYFPTQDYSFLLDENHYVYDHVENEDSLHIYIKSRDLNEKLNSSCGLSQ